MKKNSASKSADPFLRNKKQRSFSLFAYSFCLSLAWSGAAYSEAPRPFLSIQSERPGLSTPEKAELLNNLSPKNRRIYEKSLSDQQRAQIDKAYQSASSLKKNPSPKDAIRTILPGK